MVRKIQLPAIGGIRKTIEIPDGGTTIAGYQGQTLTLAQLATLLGVTSSSSSSSSSSGGTAGGGGAGSTAFLSVGTGLTGGGALVGNVPIGLSAAVLAAVANGPPTSVTFGSALGDMGPRYRRSGKFKLSPAGGFRSSQVGKPVIVQQESGTDEDEMAQALCTGKILNRRDMLVRWIAVGGPMKGTRRFLYVING